MFKDRYKKAMSNIKPDEKVMDNILNIAEEDKKVIKLHSKSKFVISTISLAACFALIIGVVGTLQSGNIKIVESEASNISTFEDVDSVKNFIKKNTPKESNIFSKGAYALKGEVAMEATNDSADQDSSSAKTYTQVAGVDEGDVIKTDGKYIYYARYLIDEDGTSTNSVNVYETNKENAKKISSITPDKKYQSYTIDSIYVFENKLVINMSQHFYYYGLMYDDNYTEKSDRYGTVSNTVSLIYNISNPRNPKYVTSFDQSGSYTSSRMIGSMLYVVSQYDLNANQCKKDEDYLPKCGIEGECSNISPKDIACVPNSDSNNYVVVTCVDVNKEKRVDKTKAVLGNATEIYCTTENLYVYGSAYYENAEKTEIIKVSYENGVKFKAYAEVNGKVKDQYAFNEKNSNLSVCTTVYKDEKEANIMYVLDEKLEKIGQSDYFAKNESIKAVKYIGDYAYVITYEQTDPLFVIDMSNPKEPQIKGSVKISGFSTMLVDIGDNKLLGIGYSTGEYEYTDMQVQDGIKFALFDISNPESPKVLDSKEYKKLSSQAQDNPKAFVQNLEKGYYAIPYNQSYEYDEIGAIVVSVDNNKIIEKKKYKKDSNGAYDCRITYVDDYYYVIDANDEITSFILK